ncbi:LysR family transcriptional regulator [Nocardiopsis sp. LOL_012]|uniref:LysR family transcriptional regulator n=1 Tax=Nocardiopsis sp. LOL_012 TaxID=3345409 RepID=UPI003A8A84F9
MDTRETGGPATPTRPDLNLLRTFLAVYRSGSFTAAAQTLGLSQPTVTAQIRNLERDTGRELFERLPRGAAPTPVAHDLAGRVSAPLDALAAATGHDPENPPPAAPVHLAGPAEYLCTRVMMALAPLTAAGIDLRVSTGPTGTLLEELRAGRHDLVVSTARPRGRTLLWTPLADEEFALVAAPAWANKVSGRLAEEGPAALEEVPLIAYSEELPIVGRYWRHVFGRRPTRRPALAVADLRGVLTAVTAGAGVAVLPTYLCRDALDSGDLVVLHPTDDPPINTAYLVQRPGQAHHPHVARVRDHLLRPGPHKCTGP